MPYTKGASNASGPYVAAGNATYQQANNWETQYDEATQSFEQDLLTPFVFSGFVATKDGSVATQLDVTSGIGCPQQADGTLRRRAVSSSTQSTVGHPSTTMYLFLNPDGTWAWQTSSTPPTNALAIAHVTTDGSSNIATVVDDRVIAASLLASMAGTVAIPNAGKITFDLPLSAANQLMDWQQSFGLFSDNTGGVFSGATSRLWLNADGTDNTQEFHIGPRTGGVRLRGFRVLANDVIFDGNRAGTFKIQGSMTFSADAGAVTTDGNGILTTTGRFRWSHPLGGSNSVILNMAPPDVGAHSINLNYNTDNSLNIFDNTNSTNLLKLTTAGALTIPGGLSTDGTNFTTDGSGNISKVGNISGGIGTGIPTTRNGAALSVPIYTGGSTPVNPPTGSMWASA